MTIFKNNNTCISSKVKLQLYWRPKKINMKKMGSILYRKIYKKKKSTINQNYNSCIEHFGDNNTPI